MQSGAGHARAGIGQRRSILLTPSGRVGRVQDDIRAAGALAVICRLWWFFAGDDERLY